MTNHTRIALRGPRPNPKRNNRITRWDVGCCNIYLFFFRFRSPFSLHDAPQYGCCVFYPQLECVARPACQITSQLASATGFTSFIFYIYFCVFLSCLFWITSYCCSFNPQLTFLIWSIPSIRFGFAKHINNSPKTAHSTYGRTWTILLLMYMSVIICCQRRRRRRRFVIHVYNNAMRHPADYVFL